MEKNLTTSYSYGTSHRAIVVKDFKAYLRALPADLYLTAMSGAGGMWIGGWWDGNVYEDNTVKEWMHAVVDAAEFYLSPRVDNLVFKPLESDKNPAAARL